MTGDAGTKWTPGPWRIDPLNLGTLGDVRDAKGNAVAQAQQRGKNPDAERTANTYLISAAPELYKALEAALRCLRGVAESAEEAAHVEDWAEAALRQARGEK